MRKRRVVEMLDGTYRLQYKIWPFWYTHDQVYKHESDAIAMYEDMARLDLELQSKNKNGVFRVVRQ